MRPGAATHAFDMEQRLIELEIAPAQDGKLHLVGPPNANIAPPGYYMLFLIDSAGVPSVATFVRLGSTANSPRIDPPPPPASAYAASAPPIPRLRLRHQTDRYRTAPAMRRLSACGMGSSSVVATAGCRTMAGYAEPRGPMSWSVPRGTISCRGSAETTGSAPALATTSSRAARVTTGCTASPAGTR